ncbi:deoxynucleoside kinase [Saccharophagus sp. K07]|jgi:deoxyguanosine kinase|uniref:deoxynucleoside kinase n=1 Tax=Saccharophagus sp. K07 TaxID=2283636 RepID=UPI0016529761|nr:deoxynucleoside kinase [Saccharophagus sp. K07]MBC6905748.1 deoxynucleoside kinase [Saccharophagus sp. K07]
MENRRINRSDLTDIRLPRYIVIEGPIGVGKTTLARLLAESLNCATLFEDADSNPFLPRYYAGEKNAALSTQLFFLMQRAQQMQELRQEDLFATIRVADFLMEKDRLFAEVTLDSDELQLYESVYEHLTINAAQPDLVIYLQAPTNVLLERIHKRAIRAEQQITRDYLDRLNAAYSRFFHFYDKAPLLIVNAADIDWVNNITDYNNLVRYLLGISHGRHYYNPRPAL